MKSFNSIAFALLILAGCQTKPSRQKLQHLVSLTAATSQNEFCTNLPQSESITNSAKIKALLSDMGYDCCSLYYKPTGEIEDSVLVLTKRRQLEVQTLYYDFAIRDRELKTWNYPNASEKRIKLEDKIYFQTSGFD
jgi:hypothetical protein